MIMPKMCKECLDGINKKHQEDLNYQRKELIEEIEKILLTARKVYKNVLEDNLNLLKMKE